MKVKNVKIKYSTFTYSDNSTYTKQTNKKKKQHALLIFKFAYSVYGPHIQVSRKE